MKMKRKGDDFHGWGSRKGLREGETRGVGRGGPRGKVLKPGAFGEAAGRTFAVLEVGKAIYNLELRTLIVCSGKRRHPSV